MNRIRIAAAVLSALFATGLFAAAPKRAPYTDPPIPDCNRVVPFDAGALKVSFRPVSPTDDFHIDGMTPQLAEQILRFFRNSCTFAVNTWYRDVKQYAAQPAGRPLDFRKVRGARSQEQRYRPGAHMCRALATALVLQVYDEKHCGRPAAEAEAIAVRLAESAAARYRQHLWGRGWQDALWAAEYAMGAWLLWDRLSPVGRADVRSMVERECDSFLKRPIPYYQDASGRIRFKGDTKAEEIAWNSEILHMGLLMMPHHTRAPQWGRRLTEMLIAAYARPEDLTSDATVGGLRVRDVLKGSNIHSDGTLVNHGRIHPDYMTSNMLSVNAVLNGAFAPKGPMPRAALFNSERVYRSLLTLDVGRYSGKLKGKHFYETDSDGRPTLRVNYPTGNDWGTARQANFALMDLFSAAFGWDAGCPVPGIGWLRVRLPEMLRMQTRQPTFRYYLNDREDRFYSREEWIAQHACMLYVTLWMKREGLDRRISDAPLF